MISGLVISVGGLQDSLRKPSLNALLEFLQSTDENGNDSKEYNLSNDILWVLQKYKRCDRVVEPTLKVNLIGNFVSANDDCRLIP